MERKHIRGHKKRWAIARFKDIMRRAEKEGLEFSLTLDDIPTPDRCSMTGLVLDYAGTYFPRRTGWMTPQGKIIHGLHNTNPVLARKDYSRGFTPDNVFTICLLAHLARHNLMKSAK